MRELRSEDDRFLAERLRLALSSLQLADLRADVRDGIAYLSGDVPTDLDRARARELSRQVSGVTDVIDDTRVDPNAAVGVPDDVPVDVVGNADLATPGPSLVSGTEGDLNGDVGTTDPSEAADPSEATDGAEPYYPPTDPVVRPVAREDGDVEIVGGFSSGSLDSPLDPEPGPGRRPAGDEEIAREVRLALREDAGTADLKIRVIVREGVVYLRGTVESLDDAELAESVASQVPGVEEVEEELDVEGL